MADFDERTEQPSPTVRPKASGDGSRPGPGFESLFWKRRLKAGEHGAGWSLPYGDLMSLLLAVFVMIAAMSELKGGSAYRKVAGGVQRAFGFTVVADGPQHDPLPEELVPRTLQERLERIDRQDGLAVRLSDGTDRPLAPCRMRTGPGWIAFRIPSQACFGQRDASLEPPADRFLSVLAGHLMEDGSLLEVRLRAGGQSSPPEAAWRDLRDLAYERGRAFIAALIGGGVDPERIDLVVSGRPQQEGHDAAASGEVTWSDCVEIVVRIEPTAVENGTFADGERDDHGR